MCLTINLLQSCNISNERQGPIVCRIDADAKLGWTPYQSVVVPLTAVKPGGGLLPRTIVLVQRRYAALYWDTLSDGRHIRRTPRAKAGADRIAEAHAEKVLLPASISIVAVEPAICAVPSPTPHGRSSPSCKTPFVSHGSA